MRRLKLTSSTFKPSSSAGLKFGLERVAKRGKSERQAPFDFLPTLGVYENCLESIVPWRLRGSMSSFPLFLAAIFAEAS